jgi:hypothetical protein
MLPELDDEVVQDVQHADGAEQAAPGPEQPHDPESHETLVDHGLMSLESLVELVFVHLPTSLPHRQQDFSCVESFLFPQPLQV